MIKVMVDSASDLTQEEAHKLGLEFVSMSVQFGEKEYSDGVDLFAKELYEKMESEKSIPKTSLINCFKWEEAFEKAVKDGSDLIVITISSKLSGSYKEAVEASKKFNGKVNVIDSLSATSGEASLALYALELIKNGMKLEDVVKNVEAKKKDLRIYALVDTLKYLKRGGRISTATAIVGTMFSIKPIITLQNGEVKVIGKAIGNKKGNLSLINLVKADGGIDFNMPYSCLFSGNNPDNLKNFMEDAKELFESNDVQSHSLGCTIGTHIGPGAVGVIFFKKN